MSHLGYIKNRKLSAETLQYTDGTWVKITAI